MTQKHSITYDSQIDALVAVAKRLSLFEDRHRLSSEEFFHKYSRGQMEDSVEFVEWSNAYEHYISIRKSLEKQIYHAA
jgi:hypothetical protein